MHATESTQDINPAYNLNPRNLNSSVNTEKHQNVKELRGRGRGRGRGAPIQTNIQIPGIP